MPQVRLTPQDDGGITIADGQHPPVYLPQLRLRMWVQIGSDYRVRQAILDTGAPAGIFSKVVWEPLADRGQIEWVCHPPEVRDRGLLPRTTVLRGQYPFRLGRITVRVVDLTGGALQPTPVLVQCAEDDRQTPSDPEPLPRLLVVGLSGILNGRTLTLSASPDGTTWAGQLSE